MKYVHVLAVGLLLVGIAGGCADQTGRNFAAKMTASQQVPPVATKASGSVQITFDKSFASAHYVVRASGVQQPTGAYIHLAPPGQNGPVVVTLWAGGKSGCLGGTLAEGTLTDESLKGLMQGQTLADLKEKMRLGRVYVSITSAGHSEGEIRGQIR